ncbi:MFS transporter [Streptomyces sp. NPDC051173]|uniref:MFS transporter n=1 Tax=Streptomyces sp. NPDC051173 TaxID=3155164 RepID=UPI00344F8C4A
MSYVSLLRRRPVLVLWLAETLSVLGDRFFTLALAWTAWQRSGAVAMGLVVVLESVPHLLVGSFGRQLVAKVASFRALAAVETLQIAVVGAMPWLWQSIGLAGVLTVIVVIGTCDALTGPSLSALVPDLVAGDQVRQVTGLMDLSNRLTWFLGPGSAAVLLAFVAAENLFLVDAATFAVSALAFAWLGRALPPAARLTVPAAGTSAKPAGAKVLSLLRARPLITGALALSAVGEFFQTVVSIGVPIWLTERLHTGPGAYALVLSAMGIGSVAGNLLAGHMEPAGRFPGGLCVVWAVRGLLLAAIAASNSLLQLALLVTAGSVLVPVTSIGLTAQIASLDGPERLRMFSVYGVKLHVASMGSMLLLPALLQRAPKASFVLGGAATAAAALVGWAVLTAVSRRQGKSPGQQVEMART